MEVVVIGGGITGLVTALRLGSADVTLLEASHRLGGKILTTPFAGLAAVDAGADAFLGRVPWALELCRELGLADALVSPATGRAFVWWDGGLHALPDGLVLGVPAGLSGLARSGLLSWRGKTHAAAEPFVPRRAYDDNLGRLVRRRFGDEVLERLVDPLVGSINAGDADALSVAASVPQLASVVDESRSLSWDYGAGRPLRRGRSSTRRRVAWAHWSMPSLLVWTASTFAAARLLMRSSPSAPAAGGSATSRLMPSS